jgi:hypothetical protein
LNLLFFFFNVDRLFQLLSEMSVNDLVTIGHSLGFSPTLDNTKSIKYNSTYDSTVDSSGNGLDHNRPYDGASDNQTTMGTKQNFDVGNAALQYKIGRYLDTTASGSANGIVNATTGILAVSNLTVEFRPHYNLSTDGKYMI